MEVKITNISEKCSVLDKFPRVRVGHGQSFHISIGNQQIIFDLGLVGWILLRHMRKLNINPNEIDKVVLSHGHMDHVGGIEEFVKARSKEDTIPIYCHPSIRIPKRAYYGGIVLWNAGFRNFGLEIEEKLDFNYNSEPVQITSNLYTTGEISLEDRLDLKNLSRFFYYKIDGKWIHDPMLDEQSLVLKTVDGLVIICGCCHPGLVNTCKKAQEIFDDEILAIVGAVHLNLASKKRVLELIDSMKQQIGTPILYLNHSTGERAKSTLKKELGKEIVNDCRHGTQLVFEC
jgi:7,8-dihydropterin-6-yl-methyl-4-(beta-D-ribofuranosyl)aminobenzene 5'-phosphate synthase